MLKSIALLTTIVCFTAAAFTSYQDYKVFLVIPKNEQQSQSLFQLDGKPGYDYWDKLHRDSVSGARIMVSPDNLKDFESLMTRENILHKMIIENVEDILEKDRERRNAYKLKKSVSPKADFVFDHFWELSEIYEYLTYIAETYPSIATVETIGVTYENRDINAVKISLNNGQITNVNPIILIDGTVHSREWMGTMVTLSIIHQLVENSDNNLDILQGLDWIVVPVVNADGYAHSHEVDRFWRKTRSPNEGSTCVGTDPNRNFNFQWDFPGGSSTDPCSNSYRGSSPASESEILALSNLMQQYGENGRLSLSIHSYGKYLLYPFGYDFINVPNSDDHYEVGKRVRYAIYKRFGTFYELGNSAQILYIASGASDDFAVGGAGIDMAFTVELPGGGSGGFDIEPERIPDVLEETYPGIREYGLFVLEKFGNSN